MFGAVEKLEARVLIVEDDRELNRLIEDYLVDAGFQVETASTVRDARTVLSKRDIDLLITDMRLPDGNGLALVQECFASSQMGIIVITGAGDDVDRILGLEIGADDFVQKPFMQRELLARVNAVLRRYNLDRVTISENEREQASLPTTFHGYALHTQTRTLYDRHGNNVSLTTLEFDVLAVLVARKNKVLTRDQIHQEVQLQAGDSGRPIDGLISRLRKKLYETDVAKERIKTVHGRGYSLISD
ncbi:response regulator transcription factor [Loktanella sp. S4079]|uniref:response regulator transcription factor n=1 Tax=Loktanella sp. S4079 TaxID=579483 RepID=UPI0005F9B032|nr:response regulator transcription factor [Loktanella sp. S4079]KJZ17932.1 hypothetical protein TW80_16490 [Loktanella sp. S4079]